MVYEFNGSDCEGYTTNFRFVTRVDMEEQPQRVTDQQTTTFESGDGDKFRFVNKTFVDQSLTKEVRGDAALFKDKTEISLTKPEATQGRSRTVAIPDAPHAATDRESARRGSFLSDETVRWFGRCR